MSALMIRTGATQALPLELLLSSIPSLPRHVLARLVDRAIEQMDEIDGDPDLEITGEDDEDGADYEQEEAHH